MRRGYNERAQRAHAYVLMVVNNSPFSDSASLTFSLDYRLRVTSGTSILQKEIRQLKTSKSCFRLHRWTSTFKRFLLWLGLRHDGLGLK